jgi:hypothetical protein
VLHARLGADALHQRLDDLRQTLVELGTVHMVVLSEGGETPAFLST